MNAAVFVTDSGEFSWIDLNRYIPRILAEVNQAGDERLGITLGLRVMPLFREALFAVNGKCFVAKLQTVYVGENGESRRKPFVGSHRINEMHVEPIENRDAIGRAALNVITQPESLAKVFKEAADRFRDTVGLFERSSLDLEGIENITVHNR